MSTDTATEQLIARWIEPNPHKPGPAEALVLPRRVSVWALIELWRLDGENLLAVAEEYGLPTEAVDAAVAYYRQHAADVDARIERNNAYFEP